MSTQEEIVQMIKDCMERESKLNDWERGFVDNADKQLADGRALTGPQDDKLTEIWERIT